MDADIIGAYRDRQRERGLSPDTQDGYGKCFRAFSRWLGTRSLTLTTCTEADVRAWLSLDGRGARTWNHYRSRLDLLFRWMRDEGMRDDVPTYRIPKVKTGRSVPRPLPTSGLLRALELAEPRIRLMLALAAYAGLRRAEIAGLTVEDVLGDQNLLLVRGKGGKERLVPMGPVVIQAMNGYGLPRTGPLFLGIHGQAISRHTVGELVAGHLRACGIDATTHQGRHWFATQVYAASGDLRITQEMLGHASPATTAIYAQWNPERAASAIASLPHTPDEAA